MGRWGKLILTMFAAFALFERELMLERQWDGIARAKAEGRYKGRMPTARAKAAEVRTLADEGIGTSEIARRLQISRASIYRILGSTPAKPTKPGSSMQGVTVDVNRHLPLIPCLSFRSCSAEACQRMARPFPYR
jgi:DNA invertase Pin-like site-specific DNA recombinase